MNLRFVISALCIVGAPAAFAAMPACGAQLQGGVTRIENSAYQIAFSSTPAPIASGGHFSLDIAVCAKTGQAAPTALRLDAVMPAHKHGMNYTPSVKVLSPGVYRAEGLLLHMPGAWEFHFDVSSKGAAKAQRLTYTVEVD